LTLRSRRYEPNKGAICFSSRAASYTADIANRNPSGNYTRDANRGNNDTEHAGR
jgi:hypothetical protein